MAGKIKRTIQHYGYDKINKNKIYDSEFSNDYDIDDRQLELQKLIDRTITNKSSKKSSRKTAK